MKFSRHVENLIANLRGLPENRSRSTLKEARSAGDLMADLARDFRLDGRTPEDAIQENWARLVGPANAEYSRLMRIDERNRAIIGVSNPIVRQELFFHRREVHQRVKALPGCSHIRSIILRAG